jgi:Na+/proline symporter
MLGLAPVDVIILIAYFCAVAAIGVISTRLIRNREDFLMGGRRFGKTLMIFFSFGAGTHADNAVGVAAQSYKFGLAGIWYQWVMLFTLPIYWILTPVFRRARVQTTADFFERRFGGGFMVFYAAFALFICAGYTSVMLYGSARLVEALTNHQIPWEWGILLMAGVSFLYGILGGLIAAVWNDFFQGILTIVMSLLILPFFWRRIGGIHGFQAALPDAHETFHLVLQSDMTLFWIVMMTINSLVNVVAQPHIMANAGAGRSEMDSRIGFVGGQVLKRLITIPWALTGVMAIALFGAKTIDPDHAFGAMARELLPAGFVGLMLACVMASVMDNCAIMMLTFAGIYTNSIHKRIVDREASEPRLVFVTRIAAAAFAIGCIGMSYAFDDVPAAMRFLWKTVSPMGIPFFLGILWARTNRYGAFASVIAALGAVLVGEYGLKWTGDAGLPKTILMFLSTGVVVGVIVSLLTRPEPAERVERFFLLLRTPIGQEDVLRQAGLVEVPGTGTFEPARDVEAGAPRPRGFEPIVSEEPDTGGGVAMARVIAPARVEKITIDHVVSRRQAIGGAIVCTCITLGLLGGVKLLAAWLAGW